MRGSPRAGVAALAALAELDEDENLLRWGRQAIRCYFHFAVQASTYSTITKIEATSLNKLYWR